LTYDFDVNGIVEEEKIQIPRFLDFDSATNRKVAITFPKGPGFSTNFGSFGLKFLIQVLQTVPNKP